MLKWHLDHSKKKYCTGKSISWKENRRGREKWNEPPRAYIIGTYPLQLQWKIWQTQTPSQNMPKNLLSIGFSLSSKVFPGLKKIRFKRIIGAEGMDTWICKENCGNNYATLKLTEQWYIQYWCIDSNLQLLKERAERKLTFFSPLFIQGISIICCL